MNFRKKKTGRAKRNLVTEEKVIAHDMIKAGRSYAGVSSKAKPF